jgi:hypothetical protein
MIDDQEQFKARLAEIAEREKRAVKRSLWLTAIPIVIGLIWLLGSYIGVRKLDIEKEKLDQQIQASKKEFVPNNIPPTSVSTLEKEKILSPLSGGRRKALELAWQLYEQKPQLPFLWGGKKPDDGGFDTSGFVAYILANAGALTQPETYYSGALKHKFAADVNSAAELQPGDLVFEENKACWIVLDHNHVIGMIPQGIVIADPSTLGSNVSYGRVPYS